MKRLWPTYGLLIIGLFCCPLCMWIMAPYVVMTINNVNVAPHIINAFTFLLYGLGYQVVMEEEQKE